MSTLPKGVNHLGQLPALGLAFLASLTLAWKDGEARPTHRKQPRLAKHRWRNRLDPFADAWPGVDLQYDVENDGVKETLLIKSRTATLGWNFAVTAGTKAQALSGQGASAGLKSDGKGGVAASAKAAGENRAS